MKERNFISDEAFSQLGVSFFSMPIEVFKDNDFDTPVSALAVFRDQGIPATEDYGPVVVFTNPDTPDLQGLYVWDVASSSYVYTIPKDVLSEFIVSGGYCQVYTGKRTNPNTPSNPASQYKVYKGGVEQSGHTIPVGDAIYAALYNGVPFVLTPASDTKLGGVIVPSLPLKTDGDGSLTIDAATSDLSGVVTFTKNKSDVSVSSQKTLAVDNKTLASALLDYAPIANPTLTGQPRSAQPNRNSPDDMIATVGYVKSELTGGDVSFLVRNQIWKPYSKGETVTIATIALNAMGTNKRLDFSFILNDSNSDASPVKLKPNEKSVGNRGVSVFLDDKLLIGSAFTQPKQSLSGVYIDALGVPSSSTDIDVNAKSYLDKKVEGSIWLNENDEAFFMVAVTELGLKNASSQISYPVALPGTIFSSEVDLKIEFYFASPSDSTFLAETMAEIIKY